MTSERGGMGTRSFDCAQDDTRRGMTLQIRLWGTRSLDFAQDDTVGVRRKVAVLPLIALQQVQIAAKAAGNAGQAALPGSSLTHAEQEETLCVLAGGRIQFLFLAPGQLAIDITLS